MDYPNILTTDNIWVIGITQEPFTREYYLVFYHEIHIVLDRLLHIENNIVHMQFADFDEIQEIGSSHYGTVYTAKYKTVVNNIYRNLLLSSTLRVSIRRQNCLFPR